MDITGHEAPEVFEPLEASAPLAHQMAPELCRRDGAGGDSCAWYHGIWQYLRLLGVITTLRTNGRYLVDTFRQFARDGGHDRVLISGTADYAMLAHLLAAYRAEGRTPDVTVVDLCETPLFLNRWFAERHDVPIEVHAGDILTYRPDGQFDLICTHSFLGRFDTDGRRRLIAQWHDLLRPGGRVITTKRTRPDHPTDKVAFSDEEAKAFRERARKAAAAWPKALGLTPDELAEQAYIYARRQGNHVIRSRDEIRDLFESGGFSIDRLDSGGPDEARRDRPSAPAGSGKSERTRIVATRRS